MWGALGCDELRPGICRARIHAGASRVSEGCVSGEVVRESLLHPPRLAVGRRPTIRPMIRDRRGGVRTPRAAHVAACSAFHAFARAHATHSQPSHGIARQLPSSRERRPRGRFTLHSDQAARGAPHPFHCGAMSTARPPVIESAGCPHSRACMRPMASGLALHRVVPLHSAMRALDDRISSAAPSRGVRGHGMHRLQRVTRLERLASVAEERPSTYSQSVGAATA
jgi:hypothetical protein